MTSHTDSASLSLQVLLVEDNAGDVRLMQEAFMESGRPIVLHAAADGLDAMAFLRREAPFADVPRPDIILLDLNMPRMTGLEVLALIKKDASLKTIPVIVLTTSAQQEDVQNSYALNANCYLRKPLELDGFDDLARSIADFWLSRAKLPPRSSLS
jgi:CheY-like chemotaxis protein